MSSCRSKHKYDPEGRFIWPPMSQPIDTHNPPPWLVHRHENSQQGLCSLPEELLLKILHFLPDEDLYFARHACHLLSRLFEDFTFQGLDRRCGSRREVSAWSRLPVQLKAPSLIARFFSLAPSQLLDSNYVGHLLLPFRFITVTSSYDPRHVRSLPYRAEVAPRAVKERLVERWLCPACISGKKNVRYSTLGWFQFHLQDCSSCRFKHPQMWFSPEQKYERRPSFADRISLTSVLLQKASCIAHEGKIRLCVHKEYTWADIRRWVSSTQIRRPNILHGDRYDNRLFSECIECFESCPPTGQTINPGFRLRQPHNDKRETYLELGWKFPLFSFPKENPQAVVTPEYLQSRFDTFKPRLEWLLCPHVTFQGVRSTSLLDMFWKQESRNVYCPSCRFNYSFERRGRWVFLKGSIAIWQNIPMQDPGYVGEDQEKAIRTILPLLDPRSYKKDEETRNIFWCDTDGCYNARRDFRTDRGFIEKYGFRWRQWRYI